MNQPGDFTQILPLEVTTTIFLYITTFEDFLSCYWVSPAWRRLIINYFFPRLSSILADNPPFSTFPRLKFKIIMFAEKVNRSRNVRPTLIYAPYSFPFLYMMYYMNNIDLTLRIRRTIYTYNADFDCNSRDLCNIVLICGSNCLRAMRIYSQLSGAFFPTFLNNLHLSTKIEKVDFERALTINNIPTTSHNPPNTSLRKFRIKNFRGTEEARNQIYQYITNNFTSIQEIQINRT